MKILAKVSYEAEMEIEIPEDASEEEIYDLIAEEDDLFNFDQWRFDYEKI